MTVVAVIPARYASTRFPGKPLVPLAGKPMIQHVWERVCQVPQVSEVLVATDDERIFQAVESFGGTAVITSSDHATGTDRIVEAVSGRSEEWVLNVQGDEPVISIRDLENLISQGTGTPDTRVGTLVFRISEPAQLHDPNIVKAVVNPQGQALYFSRSLVPFPRKPGPEGLWAWRHLGVYLYQREFLLQYHQWPQTPLEQTEQLEQLRILENGVPILCVQAHFDGVGVDVPEDVPKAESLLQSLAQQKEKR